MKQKELKRMSRGELVEIIYAMKKREIELTKQIEELEEKLNDKVVKVEKAGSLADAAFELSGVFVAAQQAAEIYLRSLAAAAEQAEEERAQLKHEIKPAAPEEDAPDIVVDADKN